MSLPKFVQRYPVRANSAALGSPSFWSIDPAQASPYGGLFLVYRDEFLDILGPEPEIEVILENEDYPFAHEAGVLIPATDEIWITSNRHMRDGKPHIQISKFKKDGSKWICEEVNPLNVPHPNGAVNYKSGVLFCAQGSHTEPGGLVYMDPQPPYATEVIVNNHLGRPFNSVNDVVIHSDGSIWFTDPPYGPEQGISPRAVLPPLVYRFDPESGHLRAMADGFVKPNGLCFSPDEKELYVTDTAAQHGGGNFDSTRPAAIYAFDVSCIHNEAFLVNKRLFAVADTTIPDGIKCDLKGNVYSGICGGDGVAVWSPGGVLIGKIVVPGGAANFCFGRDGEMFILNENKVWRAKLGSGTKGALLGI